MAGFKSPVDFAFANWLHQERISKNAINRLVKDPRMQPLLDLISWTSAEQYREKVDRIDLGSDSVSKWASRSFEYQVGSESVSYTLRYRSVQSAVKFLLGHAGFKHELIFAPRRMYTCEEPRRRIYTDMASGDWWWDTQKKIRVEGATVVPLIIGSDKTLVTNLQGDKSAHPVYLTVGNLPAAVRNSNIRPGTILLAMLPVVKHFDALTRNRLYHECLKIIFDEIRECYPDRPLTVTCADGLTRTCFPIIAALAVDHEEQVKITGVKSNVHCTMCDIAPDLREDLEASAPYRTHRKTKERLALQERISARQLNNDLTIHDVDCFAFDHQFVNVYKSLMVDILHQLFKGVLTHTVEWIHELLYDKMTGTTLTQRQRALFQVTSPTLTKQGVVAIIDKRYAAIAKYTKIRVFKQFSKVSQWTGKEQKSVLRQALPVYAPLLIEVGAIGAVHFLRALVDFILLALYRSHDDDTLGYMDLALHRMNEFKETFRPYRAKDKSTEGHFNFPKFHSITHYPDMIRRFGNAPDLETGHFEHRHVDFVKNPFKLTNKRDGWEDQIMDAHRRHIHMLAALDIGRYLRPMTVAEKREAAERPNMPLRQVDIEDFFGWPRPENQRNGSTWRTIAEVETILGREEGKRFRSAVAVFVREARSHRAIKEGVDPDRVEKEDEWVLPLRVKFHPGVCCWKRTGEDPDDPDAQQRDIVRCTPNWLRTGRPRNDWVLVQEYSAGEDNITIDGKLPAQLRFVLTVEDDHEPDSYPPSEPHRPTPRSQFAGAYVHLYRPKKRDQHADDVHGMTEISPMGKNPHQGILQGRRVYQLSSLHHAIHVVPKQFHHPIRVDDDLSQTFDMYINNTADFASYNMLWNEEWERVAARATYDSKTNRIKAYRDRVDSSWRGPTGRTKQLENSNVDRNTDQHARRSKRLRT